MTKNSQFLGPGANKSQENLDRSEPVIVTAYGVIGEILLLGGTGYVIARWLGTNP